MSVEQALLSDKDAYHDKEQLLAPLRVMYKSLMDTRDDAIANGRLLDVLRQVEQSS